MSTHEESNPTEDDATKVVGGGPISPTAEQRARKLLDGRTGSMGMDAFDAALSSVDAQAPAPSSVGEERVREIALTVTEEFEAQIRQEHGDIDKRLTALDARVRAVEGRSKEPASSAIGGVPNWLANITGNEISDAIKVGNGHGLPLGSDVWPLKRLIAERFSQRAKDGQRG